MNGIHVAASRRRLLKAVYHEANCYAIVMDAKAPRAETDAVGRCCKGLGNVALVPDVPVAYRGASMVTSSLTGYARLLGMMRRKTCQPWWWAANLSASDFPLMTPREMRSVMALAPRDTVFLSHIHPERPEERWWHASRMETGGCEGSAQLLCFQSNQEVYLKHV